MSPDHPKGVGVYTQPEALLNVLLGSGWVGQISVYFKTVPPNYHPVCSWLTFNKKLRYNKIMTCESLRVQRSVRRKWDLPVSLPLCPQSFMSTCVNNGENRNEHFPLLAKGRGEHERGGAHKHKAARFRDSKTTGEHTHTHTHTHTTALPVQSSLFFTGENAISTSL